MVPFETWQLPTLKQASNSSRQKNPDKLEQSVEPHLQVFSCSIKPDVSAQEGGREHVDVSMSHTSPGLVGSHIVL